MKELIKLIGFKPEEGREGIYYKSYENHENYIISCDFNKKTINYGNKIRLGDLTTSNFSNTENFVVLECVDRLLVYGTIKM